MSDNSPAPARDGAGTTPGQFCSLCKTTFYEAEADHVCGLSDGERTAPETEEITHFHFHAPGADGVVRCVDCGARAPEEAAVPTTEEQLHELTTENFQQQEPVPKRGEPFAREVCSFRIYRCRGHWHAETNYPAYPDEASAKAAALGEWAERESEEDVRLLESLAKAEEDRFNASGIYIPNEIPGILRRIANDYVRYRALAAQWPPERAPATAFESSRSSPTPKADA